MIFFQFIANSAFIIINHIESTKANDHHGNTLIRNSTLFPMDIQWILQGFSIGFQGFFVEFLGLSDSINHYLPQTKFVKSSYKTSFNESVFGNADLLLNVELFDKEGMNIKNLISNNYQNKSYNNENTPYFKFDMKSHQLINNSICSVTNFEVNTSYMNGNLPRGYVDYVTTPTDCCEACVHNKQCLSWTYDVNFGCNLKGSMKLNISSNLIGSTSGKMIAMNIDKTSILSTRPIPPKALIFHGTTCIYQNETISPKTRDINTILIGRYMVERSYISKGMTLDEYAVISCAGRMDEIWVPTEWHKDIFIHLFKQHGSISSMPLISVIPEAVDTSLFIPNFDIFEEEKILSTMDVNIDINQNLFLLNNNNNNLNENIIQQISIRKNLKECIQQKNHNIICKQNKRFEFLSIFKWEYRKGWDILLDAYWNAFKPTDAVILRLRTYVPKVERGDRNITRVLETYALEKFGLPLHELATVTWEIGKITIKRAILDDDNDDISNNNLINHNINNVINVSNTETSLTRSEIRDLLSTADAFVLPTRGEGWGLPIAEAMSMALPVIVTNYSGTTAYTNDNNAYLIPIHQELDELSFAKPNMMELIKIFHQIIIDSTKEGQYIAQRKGLHARQKMKEISSDSIVLKMISRLRYHADIRGWIFPST